MCPMSRSYQHALRCILVVCMLLCTSKVSEAVGRPLPEMRNALRNASIGGVTLHVQDKYVTIDNGILQLTLSKPQGMVTGIKYNGIDNLLEASNKHNDRGYWDVVFGEPGHPGTTERIEGTNFQIITQNDNQVEVSFARTWNPTMKGAHVPLNVDKRFIMLRGSPGFYSYGIFEYVQGSPDFDMSQSRIVFKIDSNRFRYMALTDDRQRIMPVPEDRSTSRSQQLAYKEAVRLINPVEPEMKGKVDDKYQFSIDNKDNRVHGWVSPNPLVGFWLITPSYEFKTGGPFMQDLTSHTGGITLAMFSSTHYAGMDLAQTYRGGEYWKKVFGPVFVYVNSNGKSELDLWNDARSKMQTEVQSWPYSFLGSQDYQNAVQRGSVTGRLFVSDRFVNINQIPADSAYVGLALPGEAGSWQRESKGYQFWTNTDKSGYFKISNVRTGVYNLYAYVPGFIGDFKLGATITVTAGSSINLGDNIVYPPRDGPTLWEIGIPDRSAAEFFIPDPNPLYLNNDLFLNHPEKFRQYGLWERYGELYPQNDLVYTIGKSDYTKDWFFAHVTRKGEGTNYIGTTRQIQFQLDQVKKPGAYILRVALASASYAHLQVNVNDLRANPPHFRSGMIGQDNAVARHGIHGLYWLFSIDVSQWIIQGLNTIYLTQPKSTGPFEELMYDYIRLEGPV